MAIGVHGHAWRVGYTIGEHVCGHFDIVQKVLFDAKTNKERKRE
jgi:hypothetical protein